MKNKIGNILSVMWAAILISAFFCTPSIAQEIRRMEATNLHITSKLPPQFLNYRLYAGTAGTSTAYYKVSAIVTGYGETVPGSVLTVATLNAVLSSTNSIQLVWASVPGATSYNLYKSTNGTDYFLLTNTASRNAIDYGQAVGAAFTAADKPGGNLVVENAITVKNLTVTGTLSPYSTGTFTAEDAEIEDDLVVGDDLTVGGDVAITGTLGVTGALTGTSGAFSTTLSAAGNVTLGAANYKSTMTASNGNWAITGNVATLGNVTAVDVTGSGAVQGATVTGTTSVTTPLFIASGPSRLYSRTAAQIVALDPGAVGEVVYCNDCTTVAVCISTGTAVADWALITDKSAACE